MNLSVTCRQLSLERIIELNKTELLPECVLAASYLLSGDESLLSKIQPTTKACLLEVNINKLTSVCSYDIFINKLYLPSVVYILKELYLNVNTSEDIKNTILSFTLNKQIGITEMLGYYYDLEASFLIESIQEKLVSSELKALLVKRANTKKLKQKLLNNTNIYFTPCELLKITNEKKLIADYILLRDTYPSTHHVRVFKDILLNMSNKLYEKFTNKKIITPHVKKGEVIQMWRIPKE